MRIIRSTYAGHLGFVALILTALATGVSTGHDRDDYDEAGEWGAVFTLTNDPEGNELAVFVRDEHDQLDKPVFVPTGGLGTGTGLGNQGALALSYDSQFLYAVNPGSDTITVFRLGRRGPRAVQVVKSGGVRPISLAIHDDLLYVLNAGGAAGDVDSIAGFAIRKNGRLEALRNSVEYLSAPNTAPAQLSFNTTGEFLLVTEKATNIIGVFRVNRRGLPEAGTFIRSKGETPFGFDFTERDQLIVSEAFGGAANASAVSSYRFDADSGSLSNLSASVPTKQSAACWISITANNQFAYTTNTGSRTISGYKVRESGKLRVLDEDGVTATTGSAPTDLTILGNRTLFVLNFGDASVGSYEIGRNGSLRPIEVIDGLPMTRPTGLVAR